MKVEDLNLMAQLVESMSLATQLLENSFEKQDAENFKKAKEEILKFQRQVSEILT